ncbi:MAG: lytic transglycosylase domain-containing protein [Alphaproteobacteria bacterium]
MSLCKKSLVLAVFIAGFWGGVVLAAENAAIVRALEMTEPGQWQEALNQLSASRDPLAHKIYTWLACKNDEPSCDFETLYRFIDENPGWPQMDKLLRQAEEKMPRSIGLSEALRWFAMYPPQTDSGLDIYMNAMISSGRENEARAFITDWWARTLVSREAQKDIYSVYGSYIDVQAHRRRFDMLLFARQYPNARAMANVLGPGYLELAEARIALAGELPGVEDAISRVPHSLQKDPGFLYERLHWRRVHALDAEAVEILYDPPPASQVQNPEDWWKERNILIRRMLEKRYYRNAYLLASKHGLKKGPEYAEAEWLGGWLALRFVKNPSKARQHFKNMYDSVVTPMSRSRGAYWAGRAADAAGDKAAAKDWYGEAAKFQTVFYGQLAGSELGLSNALPNAAPPKLNEDDLVRYNTHDLVRASKIFYEAGMKSEGLRFLKAFLAQDPTPKAYRFAAELAAELGQYSSGLQIAKDATAKGMFLTAQSYPMITERMQAQNPEWALVHSIIRQESMFDAEARSPSGALGLMQLMPDTAREVAGKQDIAYRAAALTSDQNYNVRLGSFYLDSLLQRYAGSYALAIAAYNAGPGNVNKWIVLFGDPRTGEIDLIDWIELIPFSETRNYVQRVMEGVYVYRLRLMGRQNPPFPPIHVALNNP